MLAEAQAQATHGVSVPEDLGPRMGFTVTMIALHMRTRISLCRTLILAWRHVIFLTSLFGLRVLERAAVGTMLACRSRRHADRAPV